MKTTLVTAFCLLAAGAYGQSNFRPAGTVVVIRQFTHPAFSVDRPVQVIPLNFSTTQFGFFCRQELKMQKAHVPLTFRLGSMDECNRLEQKPGYR